MKLIYKR